MKHPSPKKIICVLSLACCMTVHAKKSLKDSSAIQLEKMIVAEHHNPGALQVNLDSAEHKTGMTDDLNALIARQPGVERIPEAGSALIVNGHGPWDSRFAIYSIPLFSISHFANHSFCDRSGVLTTSAESITLQSAGISHQPTDGDGGQISVDPGFVRRIDSLPPTRPEAFLHAGFLTLDLNLLLPLNKGRDQYQISISKANEYFIHWKNTAWGNGNIPMSPFVTSVQGALGYAQPRDFGDVAITGMTRRQRLTIRQFAWLAYDSYANDFRDQQFFPWGVGGIVIEPSDNRAGWKCTIGGAYQHYFEGKMMARVIPLIQTQKTVAAVHVERDDIAIGPFDVDLAFHVDGTDWQTALEQRWYRPSSDLFDSTINTAVGQREVLASSHTGLQYRKGSNIYGATLLIGNTLSQVPLYVDPALWWRKTVAAAQIECSAGIHSTRPDIRGMPDVDMRGTDQKTMTAKTAISNLRFGNVILQMDMYGFWKNREPRRADTPSVIRWDPTRTTPLAGFGLNVEAGLFNRNPLALRCVVHLGRSMRRVSGDWQGYEWEIPWSIKPTLDLSSRSHRIHLFLNGFFSAGIPYQEVYKGPYGPMFDTALQRMPVYRRIDLKVQVTQEVDNSSFLTRLDGYVEIPNFFNFFDGLFSTGQWIWENTREYYWDKDYVKHGFELEYATLSAGIRAGFRLGRKQ
jgi:hypothetical protein